MNRVSTAGPSDDQLQVDLNNDRNQNEREMLDQEDQSERPKGQKPKKKTCITEHSEERVIAPAGRLTVGQEWQHYKILTPQVIVRERAQLASKEIVQALH